MDLHSLKVLTIVVIEVPAQPYSDTVGSGDALPEEAVARVDMMNNRLDEAMTVEQQSMQQHDQQVQAVEVAQVKAYFRALDERVDWQDQEAPVSSYAQMCHEDANVAMAELDASARRKF